MRSVVRNHNAPHASLSLRHILAGKDVPVAAKQVAPSDKIPKHRPGRLIYTFSAQGMQTTLPFLMRA
jgi:hypothetical protein